MSSLHLSFALLLLLLSFTVHQIFYMEYDLINPYDLMIKEFLVPGVLSAFFLLTLHWFLFLMSMLVLLMISSNLFFLYSSFLLVIILLCSAIYQIFCIDDLGHDLINPYHLAGRIKGLITKEFVLPGILCAIILLTPHLFTFLMSAPITYYHINLYTGHPYLMEIAGVVFSELQNGKRYWMFELGVYVVVFLTIAFANSYNGEESEESIGSTGTSGHPRYYDLIYITEFDWHIETVPLDLDAYIQAGDIVRIQNIIAPFVTGGGGGAANVTIEYVRDDDEPLPTLRPLVDLLFQGEFGILNFFAYPSYMEWPANQSKYVAVERTDLDGSVRWVNIHGTVGLEGLRHVVVESTGVLPPDSRLLWSSAKGELEELDFVVTEGGEMWNMCLYPVMKIFVHL